MIEKEDYITPKFGTRFLYEGNFDLDKLLAAIKSWYREHRYILTEKTYEIKDTKTGKEAEIEWNGFRKFDEYARFHIDIKLFGYEIKKAGKLDTGRIELRFIAYILLDYKDSFKGKSGKFLRSVYHSHVIKDKIYGKYEGKLSADLVEIRNIVKEHLDFYT